MLFAENLPNSLWPEVIEHGNWLRSRLPASRINDDIPIKRWDTGARVDYKSSLEFGTTGFAFIYFSDSAKGKKFHPRAILGKFVDMESSTRLIKVYITKTKEIYTVRRSTSKYTIGTYYLALKSCLMGLRIRFKGSSDYPENQMQKPCLCKHFYLPQLENSCLLKRKESIQTYLYHSTKPVNIADGVKPSI